MCVIMAVEKERPTRQMVEKAWSKNGDGGGAAWREPAKDGHGTEVVWSKGHMDEEGEEEMQRLAATLPMPFILHFRVASSGGIRPSLTHPFPIDDKAPLGLTGRTKNYVLFHNGDWKDWDSHARSAAINSGKKIPLGRWSDTRAIAWLCSIYGPGWMEFLPEQKGVVFGPKDYEIFVGRSGWQKVNNVWCSNDYFLHTKVNTNHYDDKGYCRFTACIRRDLDSMNYCPLHTNGMVKSALAIVSKVESGGTPTVSPFALTPEGLISLGVAEDLHKQTHPNGSKRLSKNKIKAIRCLWEILSGSAKQKHKDKAKASLFRLSMKLAGLNPNL